MQKKRGPMQKKNGNRGQNPEQQAVTTNPDELRRAAKFFEEEVLRSIHNLSDIAFPLEQGDLRRFPRPSPRNQAAELGKEVLREWAERAAAAMYLLAAAMDNDRKPSPAVFALIQPYLVAFRARTEQ